MSESPYFRKVRSQIRGSRVDMSQNGSRHFVRAPSSAHGSFVSAGSLISTLTDIKMPCPRECCRSERGNRSCRLQLMNAAASHFKHCPVFAEKFKKESDVEIREKETLMEYEHDEKIQDLQKGRFSYHPKNYGCSCLEHADIVIDRTVRHLCGNGCYLRAFAAMRGWHALRSRVHDITGRSPEHVLARWKCLLVPPSCSSSGTDKKDLMEQESSLKPSRQATQIIYIDPFKSTFSSISSSLESLGLVPSTKNRRKRPRPPSTPPLVRSRFPQESEICASGKAIDGSLAIGLPPLNLDQSLGEDEARGRPERSRDFLLRPWANVFPASPFGLLEELFSDDPWRLLLSTIMLNRTSRVQVDSAMRDFLQEWPDPKSASAASPAAIASVIRTMGICNRRSKAIVRFSMEYVALIKQKEAANSRSKESDGLRKRSSNQCVRIEVSPVEFLLTRKEVLSLYSCGQYAYDAYRIFVQQCHQVSPSDHALELYVDYCRGLHSWRVLTQ